MKGKIKVFRDDILKIIKEKRIYCIIAIFVIFAISSIFIIISKDIDSYVGNQINGGFALNVGKWTYYIKKDGIYKVNSNGDKNEQILAGTVYYLNSDGKYLYFVESNEDETKYDLAKVKENGKDKQIVLENIDNKMITVSDGWIYYLQDDNFYKVKTDGKDRIKLLNKDVEAYQIDGNNIYYAYKEGIDCLIARMKTDGTEVVELENDCNPNFYVKRNKIYYIKEKYNEEKYQYEYTLHKMKISGENKEEIIKLPDTIKQINMAEDGLYYLITDDYEKYELYKMEYNGEGKTKITETSLNTKINVIEKNIYYMDLINESETAVYKFNAKSTEKQVL